MNGHKSTTRHARFAAVSLAVAMSGLASTVAAQSGGSTVRSIAASSSPPGRWRSGASCRAPRCWPTDVFS